MSADAIIAGLKQGNAMEMATIEEVKAGMTSVLDGMLRECFNRSDGLSELMEKLQLKPASATTTNLTAEQNAQLTHIIKNAISSCERAIVRSDRKEQRDVEIATTAFEAEKKTIMLLINHIKGHLQIWRERTKLVEAISERSSVHDHLTKLGYDEWTFIRSVEDPGEVALRDYDARKTSRFQEIESTYKKERSVFVKQIARLERIAIIAGIDLKATSTNGPSDGVPIQGIQAPHLSLAPSPVGRGGRNSFSFRAGVRGLGGVGRGRGQFRGQAKP